MNRVLVNAFAVRLQSARSVWRQRISLPSFFAAAIVAICTERVEAKEQNVQHSHVDVVAICTERVEAKHAQPCMEGLFLVAICTERVEAKSGSYTVPVAPAAVAICTERVEAKRGTDTSRLSAYVAICTERVEAKEIKETAITTSDGCNLHGACGGKEQAKWNWRISRRLQSARSVWRQRHREKPSSRPADVAICTERVEAKVFRDKHDFDDSRCNLHGACGGKDHREKLPTCSSVLQSARDVWKVLQYPSTKKPRKFMQTYCIFIHLGV